MDVQGLLVSDRRAAAEVLRAHPMNYESGRFARTLNSVRPVLLAESRRFLGGRLVIEE